MSHKKYSLKEKRAMRVRSGIKAVSNRPRLSVFKSNKHLYAQLIDDTQGVTLVGLSSSSFEGATKTEVAAKFGAAFAAKVAEKKVEEVVFDRGASKFHGRVKAFADSARENGLKF
ncbi:MAG: 50S ribosomal protein L18 [Chlamydiae bacterium]|jgi:large subunit ribosomal protein L18|nr:50S ribosomal protein L18 [Chlamydiota bacterium]